MFAMVLGHWDLLGYGMFSVVPKHDREPVALVGLLRPEGWPEGEIAWNILMPAAEGQGFAAEAARAARGHAFGTLGWSTAVSYIGPDNDRSIALAQYLGAAEDPDAPRPESSPGCLVFRHRAAV